MTNRKKKQVAAAQAAKRAERETLTTDSRMRGRPKEESKKKAKPMRAPKELSEEEKARRQQRQVTYHFFSHMIGWVCVWGGMSRGLRASLDTGGMSLIFHFIIPSCIYSFIVDVFIFKVPVFFGVVGGGA